MLFQPSIAGTGAELGKNGKNGVEYRVLDDRIKGVEKEIEIELVHNNDKGVTLLKLYGPNKKKENVVSVTRSKK